LTDPLYFLDTNSCIHLLAVARPLLTKRVQECSPGTVAISAIVCAELSMGLRENDGGKALLDRFVHSFPVIPFDEDAARAYARVPFRRGKFDRLIAAHCLARDMVLVTSNVRDFSDVPGLRLEDWADE
jgi:tRNA(fMet)-specific endonuclease VapC